MDDGETPTSRPAPPAPDPRPAPTETELSRIAREAVHQAPDPRLDRHLQRMGLVDAPEATDADPVTPGTRPVEVDPARELLDQRVRRLELSVVVLAIVLAVLAMVEVIQIIR
jgi:hypothetical protein